MTVTLPDELGNDGFSLTDSDMQPTEVPGEGQEVPRKRRGRQPLPRDAQGNIIRPQGWQPRSKKNLDDEEAKIELRKQRIERYTKTIKEEVNPFVLDLGCMIAAVPKESCIRVQGDKVYATPIGSAIMFNDVQVNVFARTTAKMYETPQGQRIIETFDSLSPYLFLGLSGIMLAMWMMQLLALRQQQVGKLRDMMATVTGEQNTEQSTNGNQPSMMDMARDFLQKMQKSPPLPDNVQAPTTEDFNPAQ